jgi:hypothetical protein
VVAGGAARAAASRACASLSSLSDSMLPGCTAGGSGTPSSVNRSACGSRACLHACPRRQRALARLAAWHAAGGRTTWRRLHAGRTGAAYWRSQPQAGLASLDSRRRPISPNFYIF